MLARTPALPRAYWLPMTVAIVLKPDFAATFTRGLGRLAGTVLGLLLATALVYAVFGQVAGRVALVGVLVFAVRSLGPANYGLTVTAITALVVVLTSFAGAAPEATILECGGYTLAGGALALAAYAAWPTWERTQTPALLANLLDFVDDVDTSLQALAAAVRRRSSRPGALPDLRADQQELADLDSGAPVQDEAALQARYRLAVTASEADRIVNSVNTMAQLAGRGATQ